MISASKHTPTLHCGLWEPEESTRCYYKCSCGRCGNLEATPDAALDAFALHIRVREKREHAARLYHAAPALLLALERLVMIRTRPGTALYHAQQEGRAAIALAEGETA